jgi:hypothetical protein
MAALNFPNSPTVNDEVELGGKTYKWDGVKWLMIKVVTPTAQALAPTITEVSTTTDEIVFTITNNDASTAVILWEIGDSTPDENSIELAGAATSSNITVTGLTQGTEYTVSATASVTGKVLSNVTSLAIETDPAPVYTAATGGTTLEYDSGGKRYKSHTFTSNGTFEVTTVGDATGDRNQVDYLIIAGGGAGGNGTNSGGIRGGGGGGAGGYRTTNGTSGNNSSARSKVTVTAQSYSIVIGAGGTVADSENVTGDSGSASTGLGVSTVGGGGGAKDQTVGVSGGSGGGAGSGNNSAVSGGSGTADEGTAGGNVVSGDFGNSGAGGGGAGQVGGNTQFDTQAGNGGNGLANLIRTGSNETRAGGGGGGGSVTATGVGGTGGGGNGYNQNTDTASTPGTTNTGSGGGGGRFAAGDRASNGGSGIVVIRYEIAPSV